MKNYAILVPLFLASCNTYHYFPTSANTSMYDHKGEAQVSVHAGSTGLAATAGIALTPNINVNGSASWVPESEDSYNSRELDFSLGLQTTPRENKGAISSLWLGVATGNSEYDQKNLTGKFTRPYIQVQTGTHDRPIGRRKSVYFDTFIGARLNYLMFEGQWGADKLDDDVFYVEPYYGLSIGDRKFRFHTMLGFSVKNTSPDEDNRVNIFPFWINIGVKLKIKKQ